MAPRKTLGLVVLVCFAFAALVPLALGSSPSEPGNGKLGGPVFVKFCGKCHSMQAVGSKGTIGPNLDDDYVSYSRVITAVREGLGGIQAEYTFANKCSPTSAKCLTWDQLHNVAKFVTVYSKGRGTGHYNPGSP